MSTDTGREEADERRKRENPDTLMFSGGGHYAAVFIGCLRCLGREGMMGGVRRIVGTSAGAVLGFFCAIGMTPEGMVEWFSAGVSDGSLVDLDVEGIVPLLAMETLGIDRGERVVEALRRALAASRLAARDVTFRELERATGYDLVVNVANLDRMRTEMLCAKTAPDLSVVSALRMAIAVPVVFTPVLWNGCVYADGAIIDNCPIDAEYVTDSTMVFNLNMYSLMLLSGEGNSKGGKKRTEMPGIAEYMCMVLQSVLHRNASSSNQKGRRIRVLNVPPDAALPRLGFDLEALSLSVPGDAIAGYVDLGDSLLASRLAPGGGGGGGRGGGVEDGFDEQLS